MQEISHVLPANHKVMVIKKEVEDLQEILPYLIENTKLGAQITRAKYLELVRSGFSKNEALMLCK